MDNFASQNQKTMKHFTPLFIILFIISACTGGRQEEDTLQSISLQLEENPDSMYHVLCNMEENVSKEWSKRGCMKFHVL